MKYLLLLISLFFSIAHADDALFSKIQSQLLDAPIIHGKFTQTRQLLGVKKSLVSTGSFLVEKKRGVIWQAEKPFPSILKVTRGEIIQSNAGQIMMKLSADKEPGVQTISNLLFALFSGDVKALDGMFYADGSVNGKNWKLSLQPRSSTLGKLISKIQLQGSGTVEHIQLNAASGDVTNINMHDVSTAAAATAAESALFK